MSICIYTRQTCFYCVRAKRLLVELGVTFNEIPVDNDLDALQQMREKSQQRTVPQIWIGALHIGGCDELMGLHRAGKLVPLLQADLLGSSEHFNNDNI